MSWWCRWKKVFLIQNVGALCWAISSHTHTPPQILEVLLLVASCHRNPNLYLFCLLNKLASVLSFMGCSVPLLPLRLPPWKKDQKEKNVFDNPPFLLSPLLHSSYELFKYKNPEFGRSSHHDAEGCIRPLCSLDSPDRRGNRAKTESNK